MPASTQSSFPRREIQQSATFDMKLPFPFKLHDMLDDMESQGFGSIISWLPHGKAFRVHQPNEFTSMIMPKYFKQTKYKSFQRQLHIYGFKRINSRNRSDYGSYYHEKFIRSEKHISLLMKTQQRHLKKTRSIEIDGGVGERCDSIATSTYPLFNDIQADPESDQRIGQYYENDPWSLNLVPIPPSGVATSTSAPSLRGKAMLSQPISRYMTSPRFEGPSTFDSVDHMKTGVLSFSGTHRNSSACFLHQSIPVNIFLRSLVVDECTTPPISHNGTTKNVHDSDSDWQDPLLMSTNSKCDIVDQSFHDIMSPTPIAAESIGIKDSSIEGANRYHTNAEDEALSEFKRFFAIEVPPEGSSFRSHSCPNLEHA